MSISKFYHADVNSGVRTACSEYRWATGSVGEIFYAHPDQPSLLYNGYRVLSGAQRPGCGIDHAHQLVLKRLEQNLYSPSVPS